MRVPVCSSRTARARACSSSSGSASSGQVAATGGDVDLSGADRLCGGPGIGQAEPDPGGEIGQYFVRQFAFGGHLQAIVPQGFEQSAVSGMFE